MVNSINFCGIRTVLDGTNPRLKLNYFLDLPVGHALYYPSIANPDTGKVILTEGQSKKWFERNFEKLLASKKNGGIIVPISKINFREASNSAVIINCLDYLYGHVLLKLLNVSQYAKSNPELSIIIIIPQSFEWLIPEGMICEAWLVDIKFSQALLYLSNLDRFVNEQLPRFDQVFLSPAYSHPNPLDINIEDYTKVKPFDLDLFNANTNITFIYREDRLWHNNAFEEYVFEVCKQVDFLKWLLPFFVRVQNYRINKLFRKLKKMLPNAKLNLVGIGKAKGFDKNIDDLRQTKITVEIEKQWCETYAKSQVVVGVHGSNMLLPTALAASFVEIFPKTRFGNITQDIFAKYIGNRMLFMGRFVPMTSSAKHVASVVGSIVSGFNLYDLYTNSKNLIYNDNFDAQLFGKLFKQKYNR